MLSSTMDAGDRPGRPPCARRFRAMTRCECTGTPFDEVARALRAGRSFDEAQVETGAGLLCSACLPDLRAHVAGIESDAGDDASSEPTAA